MICRVTVEQRRDGFKPNKLSVVKTVMPFYIFNKEKEKRKKRRRNYEQ